MPDNIALGTGNSSATAAARIPARNRCIAPERGTQTKLAIERFHSEAIALAEEMQDRQSGNGSRLQARNNGYVAHPSPDLRERQIHSIYRGWTAC